MIIGDRSADILRVLLDASASLTCAAITEAHPDCSTWRTGRRAIENDRTRRCLRLLTSQRYVETMWAGGVPRYVITDAGRRAIRRIPKSQNPRT